MADRVLTALERCVLAQIGEDEGCTAYAVAKAFERSPNPHWTGSAGAIYPLVHRLERKGFVRSEAGADGARAKKAYALTEEGRRAVRGWFRLTEGSMDVAAFDSVRMRVRFLGQLPKRERERYLREVGERLDEFEAELADARARWIDEGEVYRALAAEGAIGEVRAKRVWLARVREVAAQRSSSDRVRVIASCGSGA